ncbi:MAG TPA: CsbD family protein [Vicinamibacterales bacterium]|nr:CsbD family protein [Vicinamibacterales bacterium]
MEVLHMPSRNRDEIQGRIDQTAGEIKRRIGRASGDAALESEGLNQRDAGDIEHGFGKARRKVGEAIRDVGNKIKR